MDNFKHLSPKHQALAKEAMEKVALYDSLTFLKMVSPYLATTAGIAGIAGLGAYMAAKSKRDKYDDALRNSFVAFTAMHPKYQESPTLASQRFSELSLISPTLATNPSLAHKVIEPRMDTGFSIDDIHRLASIEHMSSHTPHPSASPTVAATNAALGKLDWGLSTFGPGFMQAVQAHNAEIGKVRAAEIKHLESESGRIAQKHLSEGVDRGVKEGLKKGIDLGRTSVYTALSKTLMGSMQVPPAAVAKIVEDIRDMEKKGADSMIKEAQEIFAEQTVSDECLGRMMSTRYTMLKEAGIVRSKGLMSSVGQFFSKNMGESAAATGQYFKLMAVPLAIGLGFSAINKLMKMRESAQVREQADKVFASLKRTSDTVKENPELANEAFDALKSFSPILATKPLITKTFVEDIINKGGLVPPQTADMLASAQQKIMDVQQSVGGTKGGFIGGLKEPMSLFTFSMGKGKK